MALHVLNSKMGWKGYAPPPCSLRTQKPLTAPLWFLPAVGRSERSGRPATPDSDLRGMPRGRGRSGPGAGQLAADTLCGAARGPAGAHPTALLSAGLLQPGRGRGHLPGDLHALLPPGRGARRP